MTRDEILRRIEIIVEVVEQGNTENEQKENWQDSPFLRGTIKGKRSVIRHLKEILETA